jgi:general secretion pathway protein E
MDPSTVHKSPKGCKECDFTGYRGRIGVYELLPFTEAIQKAARSQNHEDAIRSEARGAA